MNNYEKWLRFARNRVLYQMKELEEKYTVDRLKLLDKFIRYDSKLQDFECRWNNFEYYCRYGEFPDG